MKRKCVNTIALVFCYIDLVSIYYYLRFNYILIFKQAFIAKFSSMCINIDSHVIIIFNNSCSNLFDTVCHIHEPMIWIRMYLCLPHTPIHDLNQVIFILAHTSTNDFKEVVFMLATYNDPWFGSECICVCHIHWSMIWIRLYLCLPHITNW